jgi:hypothetical protein
MRQLLLSAAGLSLLLAAGPALAQHNAPAKAKALKMDLATAFNACTASNDTTGGSPPLPACTPPVLTSSTNGTHVVTFGLKGAANVQVGAVTGDIKIGVKSGDIDDNGVLIADNEQLGLHIDHAVTTTDSCVPAVAAGCTSIDVGPLFNNTFKTTCLKGKCTLKTTVNTLTPGQIVAGDRVNITLSGIGMNDQDGDLCFSEGLFIP